MDYETCVSRGHYKMGSISGSKVQEKLLRWEYSGITFPPPLSATSSRRDITTDIIRYMRELEAEFTTRFVDFKRFEQMFYS